MLSDRGQFVLRADRVQDLDAGLLEPRGDRGDHLVEPPGALRAAGDQQRRQVLVEAEGVPGLGADRGPVQGGDGAAQRDADVARVAQLAVGGGDGDRVGVPGADLVGQARAGVGLVDDDRHAEPLGGEVAGQRDVAAEADDAVGLGALQDLLGGLDGAAQPPGDGDQFGGGPAGQRYGRDQRQFVAALGHEPGLQALLGAECGDPHGRVLPAQGIGERERRLDVAGGPPTGEYDMHRNSPLSGRPPSGVPSHRPSQSPRSGSCAPARPGPPAPPGSLLAKEISSPTANMVGRRAEPP